MEPKEIEELCDQAISATETLMGAFEDDTPEYEKAGIALSELQELSEMLE